MDDANERAVAQAYVYAVGFLQDVDGFLAIVKHLMAPSGQGDDGLFEALRPATLMTDLLNPHQVLFGAGDDLPADGWELFSVLNGQIADFFESRGQRVLPVPTSSELEAAFGEIGDLVGAMWPVVGIHHEILRVRGDEQLSEPDKERREQVLTHSARALCLLCARPAIAEEHFRQLIKGFARTAARRWKVPVEEIVAELLEFLERGRERKFLAYDPTRGADFFAYWSVSLRHAALDIGDRVERRTQSHGRAARSTVANWKRRGDYSPERHDQIAGVNAARRKHHDPSGKSLTVGQLAYNLGRSESAVRSALSRAEATEGKLAPRLDGSRSYALDDRWQRLVERHLGRARGAGSDGDD